MKRFNFLLLITTFFMNADFATAASEASSAEEVTSVHSADKWMICSLTFEINWGMKDEDTYISMIDCKEPANSRLVLSDAITAKNRTLFKRIYVSDEKEASDSTEILEDLVRKTASFAKPAPPIEDDSTLLGLMSSSSGLIWTGSGISLQSGIPTLPDLYGKLRLIPIPYCHAVEEAGLRNMAAKIDTYKEILFDFLVGVFRAKTSLIKPSPAHHSIGGILKLLVGALYITSNLDHLEDHLGYGETVKFEGSSLIIKFSEESSEPQLFVPSWVLMVGLRVDDYGIAKWAAEKDIPIYYVNPNAPELASLYSEPPCLLQVQWIQADAQVYIPSLLTLVRD